MLPSYELAPRGAARKLQLYFQPVPARGASEFDRGSPLSQGLAPRVVGTPFPMFRVGPPTFDVPTSRTALHGRPVTGHPYREFFSLIVCHAPNASAVLCS
jgi:hypothetical protein